MPDAWYALDPATFAPVADRGPDRVDVRILTDGALESCRMRDVTEHLLHQESNPITMCHAEEAPTRWLSHRRLRALTTWLNSVASSGRRCRMTQPRPARPSSVPFR